MGHIRSRLARSWPFRLGGRWLLVPRLYRRSRQFAKDQLFQDRAIPIVGHSLGGNIAGVYAGLRPKHVSHIVSLDGFGPLMNAVPAEAKTALRMSLDGAESARRHSGYATLKRRCRASHAGPRGCSAHRPSSSRCIPQNLDMMRSVGGCLIQLIRVGDDAKHRWLFDPTHQKTIPTLRRLDEWYSIWSDIEAQTCWLASTDHRPNAPTNFPEVMEQRAAAMGSHETAHSS